MNIFNFYFIEGWKHIISANATDHQLFVAALAIIYMLHDWKKVLILVTAFTIGHSLTLVLSVFDVIIIPPSLVEFLIPITIALTALWNLFGIKGGNKINNNYFLALFFGLIHGLGFANYIRLLLAGDQSLATGLLGFNLGLEAGQLIVVAILLLINNFFINVFKIPSRIFIFVVSAIIFCFALVIIIQRFPSFS